MIVLKFVNYLEDASIIIKDNASYHFTIVDEVPNTGFRKRGIQG
jgi:hypothetical protein